LNSEATNPGDELHGFLASELDHEAAGEWVCLKRRLDQNAPKVKTALFFGLGLAISLGGGCTSTLSLAPANPAAATADQGVPCLQSVKKTVVSVWLLTPEYQTDLREFDPPAFRVLVSNNGDTAFDFSPVDVTASSGENSVHVFTREEYYQAINRYEGALLKAFYKQTAQQKPLPEELLDSISSRDPLLSGGSSGQQLHDFSGTQNSDSLAKNEKAAGDRRTAIYVRRKELLDEASLMLVPHTVAPGATAGGIIKLDPAHVGRGQPLKLVVTAGGETHEFVFDVGG
jgi:hypothetical protein